MPPEERVLSGRQGLLLQDLLAQGFQTRGNYAVGPLKAEGLNQLLDLARIRLIFYAGVRPSDDPIEDSAFLAVLRPRADPTPPSAARTATQAGFQTSRDVL